MDSNNRIDLTQEINNGEMQSLQDVFCHTNDMYVMGVSKKYGQITAFSGDKSEEEFVDDHFSSQLRREIMDSFVDGDAENIIERYGTEDYLLYRGVAIRGDAGELVGVWLCFGVDATAIPEDVYLPAEIRRTSLESFDKAISLLETLTKYYFSEKLRTIALKQQLNAENDYQKNMEYRLKKNEIMTDILRHLESEDSFTRVSDEVLKQSAVYLECSNTALLRLSPDGTTVDMISEWAQEGAKRLSPDCQEKPIEEVPFMNGKPYTISADAELPASFEKLFSEYDIKAGIFLPISVNNASAMYVCFMSIGTKKKWTVDDLRFANDIKRILHTILAKKITKNSLASSYNALEAILQNASYGVAVSDVEKKQLLYTNDTFSEMFSDQIDRVAIEELLFDKRNVLNEFSGYSANGSGKWYDINFATIKWVDGREVRLTTFYDITDLRAYQKKIEKQAQEDILTGLFNRQACEKDISAEFSFVKKTGKEFAVLMLDLDDFANINEGLGHKVGDKLLKYISRTINDINHINGKVYRIGGDEFAVLIDHEIYPQLDIIVKRIRNLFENPWVIDGQEYYCTMSMGGIKGSDASDSASVFTRLNIALHEAKKKGKNRFQFYDADTDTVAAERLKMEQAMRRAVEEDCKEFVVLYQPIMEFKEGVTVCCGAEALLRWESEELGLIMPEEFIPVAEHLGLITQIGDKVLKEAAKSCKHWNDFGHPEYKINVNLSVVQITQSDIVEKIRKTLEDTAIDPVNLTLEVTESLAINDIDRMISILDDIRALGCRVALDDFGTGYSSLNHIKRMPIDTIKIDKIFVQDVDSDNFSEAFVKTVSELADTLGINVCVEGVEEDKQLDMIGRFSVNLAQGFLFDKPLSNEEFENKYL